MEKLTVSLKNCYGIKSLKSSFDFTDRTVYAIYAPNGSMKSSFAQTFKDVAEEKESSDRIFPLRDTAREIKNELGNDLQPDSVLVLPPYDEFFGHTEKTSTLLVNNALRTEYERLHEDLERCKDRFVSAMKEQSGLRKDIDKEIAHSFMKSDDNESFYRALERVQSELKDQSDSPFESVKYKSLFEERALSILETSEFKEAIQDYITRYNELLDSSTYFKKGVFEYYNASQIAKTLKSNGFFDAKHTVTLNAEENREIKTQQQLEEIVQEELDGITNDRDLKAKFDNIKRQLEQNQQLRSFQQYLSNNSFLLPHLDNIGLLKEKIWLSYFKAREPLYDELITQYRKVKDRRQEIENEAREERTRWESAIELFNERFYVPFTLEAKNKAEVMLGYETTLELGYTFHDGDEKTQVEHKALLGTLSQGEKKALYILNVIFEIEVRRNNDQETLFVVDDIADSFDYKNKYAIIQYLQEISEDTSFKLIVLTHNFDFFRTISSRFVGYSGCLMATKNDDETILSQAEGIRNPFLHWRNSFYSDGKKRVAAISFTRNLIEHTRGRSDDDYLKLTSLLHWTEDTAGIKQKDLDEVFHRVFNGQDEYVDPDETVIELIEREAIDCMNCEGSNNLENKIVLAIATRINAEKYMAQRIDDLGFLQSLGESPTPKLLNRFKGDFSNENDKIRTLRKVLLMTPENIHLNAFMYEPILDMSDDSLRDLYNEVCQL